MSTYINELKKIADDAKIALISFEENHRRELTDTDRRLDHNFTLSSDESENHVMDLSITELHEYNNLVIRELIAGNNYLKALLNQ
jgi:hypothetical protein